MTARPHHFNWAALLGGALAVLALAVPLAIPASSDAAHFCGRVSVESGGDESSAYAIRAKKIACDGARRVLREYLRHGPPGRWAERTNPSSFTLYKGRRQITFRVAS